ncbi:hypothetical protein ARMSODRAFT_839605, partial [Armillaria solidipes]
LYCKKVQHQLAQKEMRKSHRLRGDGMPQLLTGNEFYKQVVEHEANQDQEQTEKESHHAEKESRANAYVIAMGEWTKADEEHQEHNRQKKENWRKALMEWEVERDLAKAEHHRCQWNKPKQPRMERAAPKP